MVVKSQCIFNVGLANKCKTYVSLTGRDAVPFGLSSIHPSLREFICMPTQKNIHAAESTVRHIHIDRTNTIPTSLIHPLRAAYRILDVGSRFILFERHVNCQDLFLIIGGYNQCPGQCGNGLSMRILAVFF